MKQNKYKRAALEAVGGLSAPSKMPGKGYGLSAADCITGAKLAKVAGTTCSRCYAARNNYQYPAVKKAHARRLAAIESPLWVANMAVAIFGEAFFRWHDSGDLQSLEHLEKIAAICAMTPDTKHWLPTREPQFIRAFLAKHKQFPPNLTVRVSSVMINGAKPAGFTHTSGVVTSGATCPAHTQGNECGYCRKCWDKRVKHVTYKAH
jgi:Gene product 88